MRVKYKGSINFANGEPAEGVTVRIFDQDAPGKHDDDLTVSPGVSDARGRFQLTYEPLRYLDFHTLGTSGTPGEPFNAPDSESGIRLPDLGDIYQPYLEFLYIFNGTNRRYTAPKGIFQTRFHLPEFPPVDFLPSAHGFRFTNSFPGYFLPFSMPAFMRSRKVSPKYGLCGGMCSAVYDHALAKLAVPQAESIPGQGTRLQRYLFRRQVDSLGAASKQVLKVAQWTSIPDETAFGTYARTAEEFNQVRARLEDKNLVILALIYERAGNLRELGRLIFNNHQVLAYAFQQAVSGEITLRVYDPNLPGRDDVAIQCEPVPVGEVTTAQGARMVIGLKCTQRVGGAFYRQVRGFFSMPYEAVKPPKGIA